MKTFVATMIAMFLFGGCYPALKHDMQPRKNRLGEDVVYVHVINHFNKKSRQTSDVGALGQMTSALVGATPIVGNLVGQAIGLAAQPSGSEMWCVVQVVRGDEDDDHRRYFATVYRPDWPASHDIKSGTWVRYAKDESGKPMVFNCAQAEDCQPVTE